MANLVAEAVAGVVAGAAAGLGAAVADLRMEDFSRICLRNQGSGGVVDIPESVVKEGVGVIVYQDQHGGDNQVFR